LVGSVSRAPPPPPQGANGSHAGPHTKPSYCLGLATTIRMYCESSVSPRSMPYRNRRRIPLEIQCALHCTALYGDEWRTVQLTPRSDVGMCRVYQAVDFAKKERMEAEVASGEARRGREEVRGRFPLPRPCETGCSPLSYSGNPGVNDESYRGANWKRPGHRRRRRERLRMKSARLRRSRLYSGT
jgi:hypothetical protein